MPNEQVTFDETTMMSALYWLDLYSDNSLKI